MSELRSTNAFRIKENLIKDADMVCYAKEAPNKPYVMCTSCDGYDKGCSSYMSKKFHNKIKGKGPSIIDI